MTVYVLVSGMLLDSPKERIARNGKPFVTATLWADDAYWNLICFAETAQAELKRLAASDYLSVQGKLQLGFYKDKKRGEDRLSQSITVERVLALRQPRTPGPNGDIADWRPS